MGNYLCGCCQIKNFQSIILQLFRVIMAVLQQSVLTKQLSTKATGKHSIAEILTYLVKTYFCDLIIFKHFSVIHFRVLALLKAYKVILFRDFGPKPRSQVKKISQGNLCLLLLQLDSKNFIVIWIHFIFKKCICHEDTLSCSCWS